MLEEEGGREGAWAVGNGRVLRNEGAVGMCGGVLGPRGVRQGRVIALSLAAGKALSLDTRVPELGWKL